MKTFILKLQTCFITLTLFCSTCVFAQDGNDPAIAAQQTACSKNSASEWSGTLNRCVTKVEADQLRKDADACNAIADLTQRANCHKKLAEKQSGLSSDPNSLASGNTTGSMIMNGVGAAYAITGMITKVGKDKKDSKCMSKKIFGVTAIAGFASDIFLKIRAKKKISELQDMYKLTTSQGSYDAQYKALEYLKEEQQTVIDIAKMEKTRNMLLMLGYGAASAMAAYEMFTVGGGNAGCFTKEPEGEAKTGTQTVTAQATPSSPVKK